MAKKIRYEIDPHNRLVGNFYGIRRVLDGRFKLDRKNTLTYHLKAPVPKDVRAPHQVKLKGEWSLTKKHDLRLTFDKWRRQTFGDQLTLKGEILAAKKNSLLFGVTGRNKNGSATLYGLELGGKWQADKNNRLTFRVAKASGRYDTLTFRGAWQINKNYEITYRYSKENLVRKTKRVYTLSFRGHWDILKKRRISYVIDKSSDSELNFKSSAGIFKDNYIKYEVGIGLTRRKAAIKRVVKLFGKWRIKRGVGLVFEVERGRGKVQAIVLGADVRLGKKNTVLFKLKNRSNQDIERSVELKRDILKGDGEAFLRLLKSKREATIQAGAGFRW
ncbi:hypothetical protein ACFLZ3_05020 [Candidatus Omnitrophota bacterium]